MSSLVEDNSLYNNNPSGGGGGEGGGEEEVTTPDTSDAPLLEEEVVEEEELPRKPPSPTISLVKKLKNMTRDAGGSLKLRCETVGDPPASSFAWLKHGAPVMTERGRVRIKTNLKVSPQWSQLKISVLETLDTAFYRCEATNGVDTVESTAIIRVNLGSGSFGTLPGSFPPPEPSFPGGMNGLPTNIQFEGRSPDLGGQGQRVAPGGGGGGDGAQFSGSMFKDLAQGNPSLKPNENAGFCQKYTGSVCAKHIGDNSIFISEGLTQGHIEQKLQGVFQVIKKSPDLSQECAEYALPTICLSTFAICDKKTQKPKKICRDECEILENDVCQSELAIAKRHPLLGHQMVLPDCEELPPIGTRESKDCVQLGFPLANQLIKSHSCYKGKGEDYRGTRSHTKSGLTCIPWSHQNELKPVKHLELIGTKLYTTRGSRSKTFTAKKYTAGLYLRRH